MSNLFEIFMAAEKAARTTTDPIVKELALCVASLCKYSEKLESEVREAQAMARQARPGNPR